MRVSPGIYAAIRTAAIGIGIPAAAAFVQWGLGAHLLPFAGILFFPAVFLAARYGGVYAGLTATILCSAFARYPVLPETLELNAGIQTGWITLIVFAVTGVLISLTQGRLHRLRGQLGATGKEEGGRWKTIVAQELPDAVITFDHEYRILDWNRGAQRLYGWEKSEVIGRPAESIFRSTAEAGVREQVRSLMAEGKPWSGEVSQLRKDGQLIWVSCSAIPLRGDDGKITGVIAVNREISDKKAVEEALRTSEAKLRTIFLTMSEGIALNEMIFDNNGIMVDYRIVDVNPAFYHTADFSGRQVIGNTATRLYGMSKETIRTFWETHRKANTIVQSEYTSPLHHRTFLISTSPFIENRFVTSFFDITDRKKAEQSMERNARLESIGVLAGGIAHDFNNLLAGIYGHLEMAQMAGTNEQVNAILQRASQTIGRARKLTGQLLTFARGGTPEMRTEDLFPFASEAVNFALAGSNMRCTVNAPQDLRPVMYDPSQFSQVLENIALNARQASTEGGLLELIASNIDLKEGEVPALPAGRYVKLTMRDHGTGMTDEVREHVFDPFFTTKTAGSGLGMATAFSIMKRHGGAIGLDSYPGWGTAFHLYLRAGVEESSPMGTESAFADPGKGLGRVLIMDDEPDVRETLEELLKFLGYEPVSTSEGPATIQAFREAGSQGRPFAAVLLDLTIPGGIGGLEVAAEIRKIDVKVPVFVITGYARDALPDDLRNAGISDALQKPFRLQDLKLMLEKDRRETDSDR